MELTIKSRYLCMIGLMLLESHLLHSTILLTVGCGAKVSV